MAASVSTYAQTKKVILEDYTGLKCGWCPEGTVILEGLEAANPNSLITIGMHCGGYEPSTSPLKNPDAEAIIQNASIKPAGFPNGAVDRKIFSGSTAAMGRGSWTSAFNQQKATTAIVSVGFANKAYNPTTKEYTADVNVEFTAAHSGKIAIQVYALEDSIPATGNLAQDNYSSNIQGGASPLNPWFHNRTFRAQLTGNAWGDATVVPASADAGKVYTYKLKFTADAAWNIDNVDIVAFVANDDLNDKEIHNAEQTHLNTFFPTGINNVNNAVTIESVFPNPASLSSVVNIPYIINKSSKVSMRVLNVLGQQVAQPYNSYEVTGSHIINWNPSNDNLTPGVYLIEVSTPEGKNVQRVNLY